MADSWTVDFDGWNVADEGRREALCTLGNGYFATRGAAPGAAPDGVHYPGTYAAGCYNRLHDVVCGEEIENESLVNLPNWLDLQVTVNSTDLLDAGSGHVLRYHQRLDLRRGVLTRTFRFVDPAGRRTMVEETRLVHMEHRHLAATTVRIVPENWDGPIRISSGIDGGVSNGGVGRYRHLSGRHLDIVETDADDDGVLLVAHTTQSRVRIAMAAATRVHNGSASVPPTRGVAVGVRTCQEWSLDGARGKVVQIEKVAALATSRDSAISEPASAARQFATDAPGFSELRRSHELAWQRLWRRFDLHLTDGRGPATGATLRVLRLGVFHLLQTVSPHITDVDAGIPARGLHGEAYRGHVFWDELFVSPVLVLRLPELARCALRYRIRRLGAARRAAREAGLPGAMFPWQSGSDGREESQRLHLNPLSGRWLEDTSRLQRHVGLAIAYNIWQYYQATGDTGFLTEQGGAVTLFEIARFFAGIAESDVDGRFHIRRVMGPDEYSTRYPGATHPGIDDNAYTNVMTVWLLRRALELLESLPTSVRDELVEQLDLRPGELDRWRTVIRRMYVPIHPDGVISQFAGYRDLAELDWDRYRSRYGDIQRLDRILEAEGSTVDEFQASKQADVLMLFYLLSADELRELFAGLGYALPPECITRTIDHYLARTTHGSTLSALVHAWVLARSDRDHAHDHFERALRSDVADVQGGTTAEGVHLGALTGCVDLVQRCFGGVEIRHDTLFFNPHWPSRFGRLEFTLRYRDTPLQVRITGRDVVVSSDARAGRTIQVACGPRVAALAPGSSVRLRAHPTSDSSATTRARSG